MPTPSFQEEFYGYLYNIWFEKVPSNIKINTLENKRTFLIGGYYSFELTDQMKIVSINSLYYFGSNAISNHEIGYNQLVWLESQLASAKLQGKTALIISHFPNGANTINKEVKAFWDPLFDFQFQDILSRYSSTVSIVLSGHTHYDDIRTNNLGLGACIGNLNGHMNSLQGSSFYNNNAVLRAVSPRDMNNPGYAILEYVNRIPKYIYSYAFMIDDAVDIRNGSEFWKLLYKSDVNLGITDYTGMGIAVFQSSVLNNASFLDRYENIRKGLIIVNYTD